MSPHARTNELIEWPPSAPRSYCTTLCARPDLPDDLGAIAVECVRQRAKLAVGVSSMYFTRRVRGAPVLRVRALADDVRDLGENNAVCII